MSYTGWKNRETWLVNLWFGDMFAEMQEDDGAQITANYIRETVENYVDEIIGRGDVSGFVRDMLDLDAIDYDELASHYETEEEVVEG
jgi:hypothetical protein